MRPPASWLLALITVGCSSPPPASRERAAPAPRGQAVIRACIAFESGAFTGAPAAAGGTDQQSPAPWNPPPSGADLNRNLIRRVIRRNLPEVRRCYESELVNRPELRGVTVAQFSIGPDGSVTASRADGFDPAVDRCVAGVIAKLRFPPPVGGRVADVNYPILFKQSNGKPIAGLPHPPRDEDDLFDRLSKPGCRTVVPPAPLVAAQTALDVCARDAAPQSSRVDLVVVLKNIATVMGPEPLRGCVDRELASMAPVAPATSCTIAIGDPAAMVGELPAIGSKTACPAALR